MKKLSICFTVLLLTFASSSQAIPINGEISFGGSYTVDNRDLTLATAFTSFSGITVAAASGDYAVFPNGTAATWTPFSFDPFTSVAPLWSIAVAPGASFDLQALSIDFRNSTVLVLSGSGTASLGNMDPAFGVWNLTANTFGTTFSFSSSAAVPDGGVTLMLLGLSFGVLAVLKRRFA